MNGLTSRSPEHALRRWVLIGILLAVLLPLFAQAVDVGPVDPPDVHSTFPHRGSTVPIPQIVAPTSDGTSVTAVVPLAGMVPEPANGFHAITLRPPEHPPRS